MRSFAGRDILSLKEFERQEFFRVFDVAEQMEPIARNRRNVDLLKDKTLVTAFYQPSTRTRLAHEAAMHRLGGHVTGFSDAKMTRAGDFYQESIKDTVKMLEFYGDVIVMRHFQQGAPHEAAKWASVPIINGGDGWGEHPTQILTDLYTVLREKGRIDGLKWLAVGDMRMRTMHSLGYALTQFDCPITFVAPDRGCTVPRLARHAHARGVQDGLQPVLAELQGGRARRAGHRRSRCDPGRAGGPARLHQGREEAQQGPQPDPANYKITRELLETKAKSDAILLHSLPRMDEIPLDVDITSWSRYWQEAFNGVVMRMALLALVLGATE